MVVLAGVFVLLYLWFTLFPGRAAPGAGCYFSAEQINKGRQYNQVLRLMFIGSFTVQVVLLLWLVFGSRATALSVLAQRLTGGNYWGSVIVFSFILWLLLRLVNFPFKLYSGYFWQHRWGLSTQTLGGWWLDYFKGAGIDLLLSTAGVLVLFWVMTRWPGTWWLTGAFFFSAWLVIQTFIWPVAVSPFFNRFVPVKDPAVLNMVYTLTEKAGLQIDRVLIMDASRRTTKANAYVAGLGRTKRIVLYDTLVEKYPPDRVKAVLAHEIAHWHRKHIIRWLVWGITGTVILSGMLFVLLQLTISVRPYPPQTWAVVLLFGLLVYFVSSPLQNRVSRGIEKEADRFAVMLTGDIPAAVGLQVDIAVRNLSDVSPPAFIRWFSYSHPPVIDRIEIIREAGKQS